VGCRGADGATGPQGPAGPPGSSDGSAPEFFIALGSGSLIADENMLAYTQVPGLTLTVVAPPNKNSTALIETDGGVQLNSDGLLDACFIDVAIFVDGNQVASGRRVTVTNNPTVIFSVGSYGFSVQTQLTPGQHTIEVKAKRLEPTLAKCYVSSSAAGSGLPGNPRLQGILNVVSFE
jgi:hypothetical protein